MGEAIILFRETQLKADQDEDADAEPRQGDRHVLALFAHPRAEGAVTTLVGLACSG